LKSPDENPEEKDLDPDLTPSADILEKAKPIIEEIKNVFGISGMKEKRPSSARKPK